MFLCSYEIVQNHLVMNYHCASTLLYLTLRRILFSWCWLVMTENKHEHLFREILLTLYRLVVGQVEEYFSQFPIISQQTKTFQSVFQSAERKWYYWLDSDGLYNGFEMNTWLCMLFQAKKMLKCSNHKQWRNSLILKIITTIILCYKHGCNPITIYLKVDLHLTRQRHLQDTHKSYICWKMSTL